MLVLLVLLLVVVVAAAVVAVVLAAQLIFAFLWTPKNRQAVFSHIFETIGTKIMVKTDVFCASEAQNHGICDVFCLW